MTTLQQNIESLKQKLHSRTEKYISLDYEAKNGIEARHLKDEIDILVEVIEVLQDKSAWTTKEEAEKVKKSYLEKLNEIQNKLKNKESVSQVVSFPIENKFSVKDMEESFIAGRTSGLLISANKEGIIFKEWMKAVFY